MLPPEGLNLFCPVAGNLRLPTILDPIAVERILFARRIMPKRFCLWKIGQFYWFTILLVAQSLGFTVIVGMIASIRVFM
jgi:hypothetical protein